MGVLMAVAVWGSILVVLGLFGFLAYRLASRIEREERSLQEWESFVAELRRFDPEQANYLEWLRENGSKEQYLMWVGSRWR